jgi:8-oxo-dGTP pyrophosphatase MutT (NUDIX family)
MTRSSDIGAAPWRARLAERLLQQEPSGDPAQALIAGLTPEESAGFRHLLPLNLARAAVLVPIVDRPEGPSVLLTQRAAHLKHHAGQVSFPGGRMEPHDADTWCAALREAQEEIGLPRERVQRAGYLADHIVISGFVVTPVVGIVAPEFELRVDRTEVEDVFEVPLAYVLDPANHVRRERSFGGRTITSWDLPWEGRHIWGATAGMLLTLYRALERP